MTNQMYLREYQLFDGEATIVFNIIYLDLRKCEIQVAVTNRGKISIVTYDIYEQDNEKYFEYGCEYTKLYIKDFKEVKNEY